MDEQGSASPYNTSLEAAQRAAFRLAPAESTFEAFSSTIGPLHGLLPFCDIMDSRTHIAYINSDINYPILLPNSLLNIYPHTHTHTFNTYASFTLILKPHVPLTYSFNM